MSDPVNSLRFDVKIDGLDLGSFMAIDGLTAEYEVKTYQEGGENGFVHQLVGQVKYSDIRLGRPIDASSATVAAWFFGFQARPQRTTARISALAPDGSTIAAWRLEGVVPLSWTGPAFDVKDGGSVAREMLALRHEGFVLE